ncbi:protein of unknown function DUF201 [Methanothermus fervidus DSM 2088]|uniref:Carbamoyl-phosphate synthase n=1 Tax=Methanothermus fervidus (strain ATCC 43054 / DSM 2088 / JCM 10308 / V24 S) TaxID=523846 RepID=E3GZ27_METFV|nr:ATP-grasp domain-containing protein [Methanothermus fervidus]ADP77559.1 protein of unknown function DUF201 [Methanothermus fervidus DSM 2088]
MKILFIGARLFDDVHYYAKEKGITTILTEANPKSPNIKLADKYFIVPRGMKYPMEIAIKEDVDAVVPLIGVDEPLIGVAKMKEKLEKDYGIPVVASNLHATSIAVDKFKTKIFFKKMNIRTPKYKIIKEPPSEVTKPVVLKNKKGQAGTGVVVTNSKDEITEYLKKYGVVLMEEFINGIEISVEVLRWEGKSLALVVVDKGRTTLEAVHPLYKIKKAPAQIKGLDNEKVLLFSRMIVNSLNAEGNTDIDMIFDEKLRKVYAIELNTRPSGTRYISAAATGIHPLHQLVDMAIGEWDPKKIKLKNFFAIEIPIGTTDLKTTKKFEGEKCWVVHGPPGHQRITIRGKNMEDIVEILEELDLNKVIRCLY